ncbi:SusC/RagA family TonB-linked outer membrane protein [Mucilaginibacter myungsuensis]|uniref:SusC/RagA family TonB-linked outer membrane protein n=1 Tax=Mucilaginibacter myungsuensis TaxID=649104 RepID=A0A929L165_9SPHI|nr:SusC/RagA family TonB-linked outer membrane protein [Mucilaginibacter myungsuensis]MBE9663698.1 SusC/RagA family TonB-linked outer membrane protein [Mucilaginibacter myungsuensis]MDN3598978.1 SusC/RagA family TonB-linked outer membrane protein [Mucilaginibacter myungsuensis]
MQYCYSKKCLTGMLALLLLAAKMDPAAAQDTPTRPGWISGVVLDEYSQPLKGATIKVAGKTQTFTTDASGKFEADVALGATLTISAPDHLINVVKAKTDMVVKLNDSFLKSPQTLDVLYGTTKKSGLLGSVATIYTNQLTTTPASLYTYAFPGQLAGVYTKQMRGFTTFNGAALSSGSIIGVNLVNGSSNNNVSSDNAEIDVSVRGQQPITVIDGVQREISSLDPESIESISVLKDGLSTILLGMNSSKPVILVTTKRGELGKPRITFTAAAGLQSSINLPKPLPAYQYAYLLNETLTSDGKPAQFSDVDFNAFRNGTDPYRRPDVNWFKTILKDQSPMSSYKLNINGGTAVAKYSVNLGYFNQGGIFKTADDVSYNTNTDLSRYIINSDVGVQVNKNLYVDLQLFGRIQTTNQPGPGYQDVLNALYSTPSLAYPVRNPDGSFGGNVNYQSNLLAMSQYSGYTQNNTDDILANLDINYDLKGVTPGLSAKLKGNLSYQSITALNRSLGNSVFSYNRDSTYTIYGSQRAQSNIFNTVYTSRQSFGQASLNYVRSFGQHNVSGSALFDIKSLATNYDLSEDVNNIALKGAYNYNEKYFIEAAITRSGDNRYPPGSQYDNFYAFGAGWQMANEEFMKSLSWITSWKWRATYARTGSNNISSRAELYYTYVQTYGNNNNNKSYPVGANYNTNYYFYANTLANPFITWEKGQKIDVGMDLSLFNNTIQFTADYYRDKYSDLLRYRGNSIALLGIPYTFENIGRNLYQGGEFSLTYRNHINNFNYFVTGNINVQTSKILFNDELKTPFPWNQLTGLPVSGTLYGYTSLGLYQTAADAANSPHIAGYQPQPGDIKYADLNNDGIIDQFDQSTIGGTKPLVFYGTTLGFNYKGFSASVILQGVRNRQISTLTNVVTQFGFDGFQAQPSQSYEASTGRWTPETAATASLPRLSQAALPNNGLFSTFYLKNGDYMRVKNAEIAYTLPYSVTKNLHIAGLRVFVNGQNLATVSGFPQLDPEVTPNNYPIQRVFNAGISVKL